MYISVFCGALFSAALSKVHWTFFTPAQRTNHRGRADVFFNKKDVKKQALGEPW